MLRFAFRSPYEHRITPSRRGDGEGGEGEGNTDSRIKKLHNATQFHYNTMLFSTRINVVVGQG